MKKVALILCILLFAVSAIAQPTPSTITQFVSVEQIVDIISANKEIVNARIAETEIPQQLKNLFGNETITVFMEMRNGETETVGFKTKDALLEEINYGGFENPTVHVFASEDVFLELMAAENPPDAVINALESGKISYRGVGLGNAIKFGVVGIIQGITFFFMRLFGFGIGA